MSAEEQAWPGLLRHSLAQVEVQAQLLEEPVQAVSFPSEVVAEAAVDVA